MDYFEKISENQFQDLEWNIPERNQGSVNVIGGNAKSFRTEVKIAEFLAEKYPIDKLQLLLPDALNGKLPPLPNFEFLPSTDSGSFDESQELINALNLADYNLVLGDLSKNSITGRAIASAVGKSERMSLITRDSIDLIIENKPEKVLMNENVVWFISMAQLQKLLRSVYYPKMLLLSQSLVQVAEVLHKFSLSYPVKIITFHSGQILLAENGLIKAVPLEKTSYSPITLWSGELAAKIVGMSLYNPNRFLEATINAIFR